MGSVVIDRAADDVADVAEGAGRAGLVSRGVIYLVVALLALRVAMGVSDPGDERVDHRGALEAVADQPFGVVLLVVLAVGFACYAVWRAVRAVRGESGSDEEPHKRLADAGRAVLHVSLCLSTVAVLRGNRGGEDTARTWTARMMEQGWGRWLVGAAGVAVVAGGLWLVRRGFTEGFRKHLERLRPWVVRLGVVGHAGRGLAFAFIGAFVVRAAWRFDASEPIGLDGALRDLAGSGWGRVVTLGVAVGLGAFGLFSIAEARDRKVLDPAP